MIAVRAVVAAWWATVGFWRWALPLAGTFLVRAAESYLRIAKAAFWPSLAAVLVAAAVFVLWNVV